ncbi:MAG TPA: signal peptidase II [Kofleriaceae bacterium]
MRTRRILVFLAILVTSTGFDQASKQWARDTLVPGHPQAVIPGVWDYELAKNPGAAFSVFADGTNHTATHVLFGVIAAIALVCIGIAAARTRPEQRLRRTAYALIAGGALGNLIDRIASGDVTDFVRWHYHEHMWPIFNVADAALLVGVGLLVVENLAHSWSQRRLQT